MTNENSNKIEQSEKFIIAKLSQTKAQICSDFEVSTGCKPKESESEEALPVAVPTVKTTLNSDINLNSLEDNLKCLLVKSDNHYVVNNLQINSLIEKLLSSENYEIENCVGQSYMINMSKQEEKLKVNCSPKMENFQ
jgi:hypothetical protein